MRNTSNYRSKTNFIAAENESVEGKFPIAVDLGYSTVKAISPNWDLRFPYYAKRIDAGFEYAGEIPASSIMYKDLETGDMWLVGERAQDIMSAKDTSDSESTWYSRSRYMSEESKVIARTSLGLAASRKNGKGYNGMDAIHIQSGLPAKYLDNDDIAELKSVLGGGHDFALKVGADEWEDFHFSISEDNIDIMSQPKGTVFSVCILDSGKWAPDAKEIITSNCIVFDAGFGTLDIYVICEGTIKDKQTFTGLGMRRILQITCDLIKANFGVSIAVPAMQKYLETGKVVRFDKQKLTTKEYEFGEYLSQATQMVCEEALSKLMSIIDIEDYKYLIVTGGTGAAWYGQIVKKFEGMKDTLTVLQGNRNSDLPFVYANVRGYYHYMVNKLRAQS